VTVKGDVTLENPSTTPITLQGTEFDGGAHTVEAPTAGKPAAAPGGLQPAFA
jgi:hypothetical protein